MFPEQPPVPSLSTMVRKKAKCSTASEGGAVEQPASDMDVKLLNLEKKNLISWWM